ncbi:MAG TPA: hypothetical protein PLS66_12735 [Tepiditoga sp.]|nr:hypothetical protein [Tepiditoga sp.]
MENRYNFFLNFISEFENYTDIFNDFLREELGKIENNKYKSDYNAFKKIYEKKSENLRYQFTDYIRIIENLKNISEKSEKEILEKSVKNNENENAKNSSEYIWWGELFKSEADRESENEVKIPKILYFYGKKFNIKKWEDVYYNTINFLIDMGYFNLVLENYQELFSISSDFFEKNRRLKNGYYVNINFADEILHEYCRNILKVSGIGRQNWILEY